jgi:hypothetical protein
VSLTFNLIKKYKGWGALIVEHSCISLIPKFPNGKQEEDLQRLMMGAHPGSKKGPPIFDAKTCPLPREYQ